MQSADILKIAVKALDDKKAQDIKVIKISDITVIADYFVIAAGTSSTQVRALTDEVQHQLKEAGVMPHHIEGKASGWILLDFSTVVIHVFYEKEREFYQLEKLWNDGRQIDVQALLGD